MYTDVIIVGDLNSNMLVERHLSREMLSFGLNLVNSSEPTHFTNTHTLLDVFFVSDLKKIRLYDQISVPAFSKHDIYIFM